MQSLANGSGRPNTETQNHFNFSNFSSNNFPNRMIEVTDPNLREQIIKEKCRIYRI